MLACLPTIIYRYTYVGGREGELGREREEFDDECGLGEFLKKSFSDFRIFWCFFFFFFFVKARLNK